MEDLQGLPYAVLAFNEGCGRLGGVVGHEGHELHDTE